MSIIILKRERERERVGADIKFIYRSNQFVDGSIGRYKRLLVRLFLVDLQHLQRDRERRRVLPHEIPLKLVDPLPQHRVDLPLAVDEVRPQGVPPVAAQLYRVRYLRERLRQLVVHVEHHQEPVDAALLPDLLGDVLEGLVEELDDLLGDAAPPLQEKTPQNVLGDLSLVHKNVGGNVDKVDQWVLPSGV